MNVFALRLRALALCTTIGISASASAQSELVFVEYGFQNPKIKAMGLNGSNPQELFSIPPSQWLPLDVTLHGPSGFLYWVDAAGTGEIMRALPNGSQMNTVLTTGPSPRGPAFDAAGKLYYTDGNTLRRANLNGSAQEILFTAAQTFPLSCPLVDATNGHVYIGADGQIRRMNLDGTGVKTVVSGMSVVRSLALDVANSQIYWIDSDTISDYIGSARLDGTEYTVLVDNTPAVVQSPGMIQFVLDPAHGALYYADDLFKLHIVKANLDGSNPQVIYQSPAGSSPSGLVLDTGPIVQPLADCNGNSIADAVDIANATSTDCNDNGFPDECEVDPCPNYVFEVDQGSNPAPPSRTLGCAAQNPVFCGTVFQPIDVPAPGYAIDTIGLDGWTANYAFGAGFTATLFPDNGTGTFPNESAPIVSAAMQFRFNANTVNWVYAPFEVALSPGRYWVRLIANEPLYHAGVNVGTSGLQSKSRDGNGTVFSGGPPIALRLAATPFAGSPEFVSLSAGGVQTLVLNASAAHANKQYLVLGSVTGTTPGLPLNPVLTLPLNFDAYFMLVLNNPNGPPIANGFSGLDAAGKSAAQFQLPANSPAILAGLTFHHAYVVLSPSLAPEFVSNPVDLVFIP